MIDRDLLSARALIDTKALISNYKILHSQCKNQMLLPMIKANAYGHGVKEIAASLIANPSIQKTLYGFGVATVEEALEFRTLIRNPIPLLLFAGSAPLNEEKLQAFRKFKITPVISSLEDLKFYLNAFKNKKAAPYQIKFNTGMNRLGISMSEIQMVKKLIMKSKAAPSGILSHLANGESPNHKVSLQQLNAFRILRREFSAFEDKCIFHLGNSSGIWNSNAFDLKNLTQVVRPGLSLYGVRPWRSAPSRGLLPVMHFQAKVLQIHTLEKNDCVGYGSTYPIRKNGSQIALLGAGYADGVPRLFSNAVLSSFGKVAGIVSMDLMAISLESKNINTRTGDWINIWPKDMYEASGIAKTIPYELFTGIGKRVQREILLPQR
jgi:alanine racemase